MRELWDTIVVGAGPSGCAAAYDLASAGLRVLLVDRAAFPRPKACAGGLTRKAVQALRYPIDPVVRHWARAVVLEEGPEGGTVRAVTVRQPHPICAMTIRAELDHYCLEQTRARGAHFQRIPSITAIEHTSAEHAPCITLHLAGADPLQARFLIGADGVHSRVRTLTSVSATSGSATPNWFRTGFAIEANVPYDPGEQYPLTFDFSAASRGYGWLFPRDNHVNVGLYVESLSESRPESRRESLSGNRPDNHPGRDTPGTSATRPDRAALERYIAARCGPGRTSTPPVGQFLGLGAAAYRPAAGARVLLIGDAAGFVDPLTGEGIYGAIQSGQAAAAAIHAALASSSASCASPVRLPRPSARAKTPPSGTPVEAGFLMAAQALQADLRIAEHAASRFFADPARGFRILRLPLVSRSVLKVYADGLSLGALLRGVRFAARLAGHARASDPVGPKAASEASSGAASGAASG